MHVAQLNLVPAPAGLAPAELLERWPSLADVAEAAAGAGTRVSVLQAAARTQRLARHGVEYHFIEADASATVAERARRCAGVLGELGVDVLHLHGLDFAEAAAVLSRHLPHAPVLLQDHASRPPRWWRRPRWRRWYATAAGVAFTAREQARPFADAGLFGPRTRIFAIPESSSRFVPGERAAARTESGLYGDPCVLWVGHLNQDKDPLSVLDGVARAASRLPGLQLWCAYASAPLLAEVRQRIARDARLAGRVHLLGRLAHAQVQRAMQAADLFVSGSRRESCGYAALEAMACGVTPVLTDIPSFRALTGGGRVGELWPCGDAAGLAGALLRAAASRPAAEQVRAHFDATLSFAAVGRQWADAYAQLLTGREPR